MLLMMLLRQISATTGLPARCFQMRILSPLSGRVWRVGTQEALVRRCATISAGCKPYTFQTIFEQSGARQLPSD